MTRPGLDPTIYSTVGKDATFRALREVYPDDDGSVVILTGDEELAARDYVTLGEQIKELTDLRDIAKARLMLAFREATYASTPNDLCFSFKASSRRTVDTKALKERFPETAAQVMRESTCRTLRKVKKYMPFECQ